MTRREPMTCSRETRHTPHEWEAPMRGGPVPAYCDGNPTPGESNLCDPPCGDPLCPCDRKPGHAGAAPKPGTLSALTGVATWQAEAE